MPVYGETIPDYDNPYAPIITDKSVYTWTDKVKISIIAPSWNSDKFLINSIGDSQDHPIKISTREHSLDQYRFTETDVNSGIFTAEITLTGFPHDADGDGDIDTTPRTFGSGPTSGFLEVDRDSGITISFEFADGVILTKSVPVSWNLGEIQFAKEIFFTNDAIVVIVDDPDMNLNPEALDQIPIQVSSDSDIAGIEITAIETSESSGTFMASFFPSQTSPSSGNRLYSITGDNIVAKYSDHTLPKPYSINDDLELVTLTKIDSSVSPIDRLKSSPVFLSDSLGSPLQSISESNQVQIVGSVTNQQNFMQKFVYIFQVKDSDNYVESISWIQGEISPNQILDLSQSWTPLKSGTYQIETFVWTSLKDPTALSSPNFKLISVE
ncbi:hypothetical protein [Nitrosopumilus sp.]|uniref:hypothetical protein n=1 Tax=Nitrosopumilus sp. TaxID=2024843 RepID=UPI00345C1268